jgi:hypothetical protein
MICKKCNEERGLEFYSKDSTCKECRKSLVRANRAKKIDYYSAYDKKRYAEDPRVRERHRRYQQTDAGKKSVAKSKNDFIAKNPVKRACHLILGSAVKSGKVLKPKSCECCGKSGRLHGHHDDYSLPLSVRWLCPLCHTAWHKENGQGKNAF